MDCIFCKIVSGDIPASKVYEDKDLIAFLDIAPASKGHVLVIPKKHSESIADTSERVLSSLSMAVRKVSKALLKDNEGVNVLQNNGKAAGQLVNHLHFHVIPRNSGDGLEIAHWHAKKYADGEIIQFQDRIKKHLKETR